MNFRSRRRDKPELNLIPMIDVLIVLLIFLVLTTSFSREGQLGIRLPQATGGTPPPDSKNIQVTIDASGQYRINERKLPDNRRETIAQALRDAAGGQREPTIEIDADRNATHQAVFTFLKAATEAGYGNLTFPYLSEPDSTP